MKYDDKKRDDSDVHNIEKTITLRGRFKKTNNFEVANCKHVEPWFFFKWRGQIKYGYSKWRVWIIIQKMYN